jgi:hypothetical protein
MQPRLHRRRGAQELGFGRRIDHPDWFCGAPDLIEPILAGREATFSARGVEPRDLDIRRVPQAIAPERGARLFPLPIEAPKSALVPFQILANRPKHMWSGGGEAIGLGQQAGDGI